MAGQIPRYETPVKSMTVVAHRKLTIKRVKCALKIDQGVQSNLLIF
jgi:hypothetical protein